MGALRTTVYFLDLINYQEDAAERGAQKMPHAGPLLTPALVANLDAPAGSVAAQQIASGPEIAPWPGAPAFFDAPSLRQTPLLRSVSDLLARTMRAPPALLIAPRSVLRGTLIVGGNPADANFVSDKTPVLLGSGCPDKPQVLRITSI